MTNFDNSPGSPDGPPAVPNTAQKVGTWAGLFLFGAIVFTAVLGVLWVGAWLISNWPS